MGRLRAEVHSVSMALNDQVDQPEELVNHVLNNHEKSILLGISILIRSIRVIDHFPLVYIVETWLISLFD